MTAPQPTFEREEGKKEGSKDGEDMRVFGEWKAEKYIMCPLDLFFEAVHSVINVSYVLTPFSDIINCICLQFL
jgi:hypothetical protein